jgi:hypothetical protein
MVEVGSTDDVEAPGDGEAPDSEGGTSDDVVISSVAVAVAVADAWTEATATGFGSALPATCSQAETTMPSVTTTASQVKNLR